MGSLSSATATSAHGTVDSVRTETVHLDTIDGLLLVGDLTVVEVSDPVPVRGAVVLAHPHPLYGGDRFNNVVAALFETLPQAGFHTVRFDFRGTNDSEGEHDGGGAERLDVAAAIDLAAALVDDTPIWLVGYSFGAIVALDVVDPRVRGWVGIAAPLAAMGADRLAASDHRPTRLLVPAHDQLGGPEVIAPLVETWRSTTLEVIPMADHSLVGRTAVVADAVRTFLAT